MEQRLVSTFLNGVSGLLRTRAVVTYLIALITCPNRRFGATIVVISQATRPLVGATTTSLAGGTCYKSKGSRMG